MNSYKHGILTMEEMNYSTNRPEAKNPVKIQDVSFRDGHQSIFATRGRTEDMITVAEQMDEIGFHSIEMWGGATFDVMHRFLNENPWDRIKTLKKYMPKTPFSMLLRGQNVVGYRNYSDDVVEAFVQNSVDYGIDIFRCFDALNDFRNFETAAKIVKKNGKHFQGTICYSLTEQRMGGEIFNLEYYLNKAKELQEFGIDSICIKDMAGLIAPYDAFNLITALKKQTTKPIHLHTHFTSGLADLTLLKAIEAGVDIIDTCMSPYAYRTSHPAVEPFVITLLGTNRDSGFDIKKLAKISHEMEKTIPKYKHLLDNTKLSIIDANVILHQTPGGMLSNLINQLRQMDALDKLEEVFEMIPKVRKDLGMVPLVTPTSQIVGTQTVNNVLFDEKEGDYSQITQQVKDLCYGLYGKTTCEINPEVRKKALKGYPKGSNPITTRPGDVLAPEMQKVKEEFKGLTKNISDEILCALYPITGKRFLKWQYGLENIPDDVKPKTLEKVKEENELIAKALSGKLKEQNEMPVDARSFDVFVDGEMFKVAVAESNSQKSKVKKVREKTEVVTNENAITAPIPGMIIEYKKEIGDKVEVGETVVILEAMKMFNNLNAKVAGVLKKIHFEIGASVVKGDAICIIE